MEILSLVVRLAHLGSMCDAGDEEGPVVSVSAQARLLPRWKEESWTVAPGARPHEQHDGELGEFGRGCAFGTREGYDGNDGDSNLSFPENLSLGSVLRLLREH